MIDTPSHPEPTRHYGPSRKKVAPFARYVGTSVWRKNRRRVREYARYLAAQHAAQHAIQPTA